MKTSKLLPVGALIIGTVLSGLTIATAQTAPEPTTAPTETSAKATPGASHGHKGGRGGPGMFGAMMQKVDADADGAVTQAEIDTFRATLVTGADTSGEGDISLDEFETIYLEMIRDRMVDAFQNLDSDGDGVVTQAEMDQRFGNVVEQMDRNDDGKIDADDRGGHERGDGKRGDRGDHGDRGDRGDHGKRGDRRG